jgi:hypothetical protein
VIVALYSPSSPGEDPVIQVLQQKTPPRDLDYRVSPLRGGPAMTEKNRKVMRDETNESRFP